MEAPEAVVHKCGSGRWLCEVDCRCELPSGGPNNLAAEQHGYEDSALIGPAIEAEGIFFAISTGATNGT